MNHLEYSLRYSKKAKHLQLRMSSHGMEVVIPVKKYFSEQVIQQFIAEKQHWIIKHWRKKEVVLPNTIHFPFMQQTWQVKYLMMKQSRLTLMSNHNLEITLMGNIQDQAACLKKLRRWLKTIAQQYLPGELALLAQQYGFQFKHVSIRYNKTRWGSCNHHGDINLCSKLLFLPFPLMRHILLHELCHTKVMHHGAKFWRLLEQHDPNTRKHAIELKTVHKYLPSWI